MAVQKIVYYHENERFREDLRENKIKEEIRTNLLLVRVFITKLLKILCFTAFKTYSNRALPIKNRYRKEYDYGKVHH